MKLLKRKVDPSPARAPRTSLFPGPVKVGQVKAGLRVLLKIVDVDQRMTLLS